MKKEDFLWGSATASFQIEGGCAMRGPSIWDSFCQLPGKVLNRDNGDIACDSYTRYKEDVALLRDLGVNAYRFSISWPRLLPSGRGEVNKDGIAYYNALIDELLAAGITPMVTLYHWDLPLELQLLHDGWLNREIVDDFVNYAKLCFESFGDRVKHWITFNEAWCSSYLGYGVGVHAPGRVSSSEAYIAGHNILLAHGRAVELFRNMGCAGIIGITNNSDWYEALTDSPEDKAAAQRALEFMMGWFTDPVVFGDYPESMKKLLGSRLPQFSNAEKNLLANSTDFIGLNHYTSFYASAKPVPGVPEFTGDIGDDRRVWSVSDPAWAKTQMDWNIVPAGFGKLLRWISDRYRNMPIYVTENGCADKEAPDDTMRCDYLTSYLEAMFDAMDNGGVDVRGYMYWSLLDNFEWSFGYERKFGLVSCSPENLERKPKKSFTLYKMLISRYRQS